MGYELVLPVWASLMLKPQFARATHPAQCSDELQVEWKYHSTVGGNRSWSDDQISEWKRALEEELKRDSKTRCKEEELYCWEREITFTVESWKNVSVRLVVSACPGLLKLLPSWLMAPSGLPALVSICQTLDIGQYRFETSTEKVDSVLALEKSQFHLVPAYDSKFFCYQYGAAVPLLEEGLYYGVGWVFCFALSLLLVAFLLYFHIINANVSRDLQTSLTQCKNCLALNSFKHKVVLSYGKNRGLEEFEQDMDDARNELEQYPEVEDYNFFGWPRDPETGRPKETFAVRFRKLTLRLLVPIFRWVRGNTTSEPIAWIPSPPTEPEPALFGINLRRYFPTADLVRLQLRRYAYVHEADSASGDLDTLAGIRDSLFGPKLETPTARSPKSIAPPVPSLPPTPPPTKTPTHSDRSASTQKSPRSSAPTLKSTPL